jgi:polar amino acid transport system permease protein
VAKASRNRWLRKPAEWFIFVFRGSPLFIQFFVAYNAFVLLPAQGSSSPSRRRLHGRDPLAHPRLGGALIVLILNTAAYSAEIFYGALRAIPGRPRGRRRLRPDRLQALPPDRLADMLRLAWPAYTNEAIFLFHSTTLVFFSGFPARQQQGDALYYARYFADRPSTPSSPTRSSRSTSSCSRSLLIGASG